MTRAAKRTWAGTGPGPVAAVAFVLAVLGIYAVANLVLVTQDWKFDDIYAYLGAAQRLVDHDPLYVQTADISEVYRYAPWFAWLWVPLLHAPRLWVEVGWAIILVGSTLLAVLPFLRSRAGIALALLLGGLLYRTAGWANVQPLLVAALVYALPTRAGPWAAGIAATIKPWALLAVGVYAWERNWTALGICVAVTAALWAPILLFDSSTYHVAARAPNLYDATILLAAPGLLQRARAT